MGYPVSEQCRQCHNIWRLVYVCTYDPFTVFQVRMGYTLDETTCKLWRFVLSFLFCFKEKSCHRYFLWRLIEVLIVSQGPEY